MKLLILGTDLELDRTDRENATVHFKIIDAEAVGRFLNDTALISFLHDPWIRSDASGCRLNITHDGDSLTIARKIGTNTLPSAACLDLISSLKTYVISPNVEPSDNWLEILQGLGIRDYDLKKITPQELPRGTALRSRDDEAFAPSAGLGGRP